MIESTYPPQLEDKVTRSDDHNIVRAVDLFFH
jgi:hypothetical protein